MSFPWYGLVGGKEPIGQGDIIFGCPILKPPSVAMSEGEQYDVEIQEYDVVVMSQSCDIRHKKIEIVLVCPVITLDEFVKNNDFYAKAENKEKLRRGEVMGHHLLNSCSLPRFASDIKVVLFKRIYGVHLDFLIDYAGKQESRLRLLPPYREHLAQAFARFFMRVGLPTEIPPFKEQTKGQ